MSDKEKMAIERLRLAAEMSERYYDAPLIITTSGGKDSDVCLHLAEVSGINYEVQHNHTTANCRIQCAPFWGARPRCMNTA